MGLTRRVSPPVLTMLLGVAEEFLEASQEMLDMLFGSKS